MSDSKVVIVTGGTYGIGRGITLRLAGLGWLVVAFGLESRQIGSVAERGIDGTRAALEQRSLNADLLEGDVSVKSDVERIVQHTLERYGRIDGLVNNAAIHPRGTILQTTDELWDQALRVNLTGVFLCTRAVIPHMIDRGGGAIVNIASQASYGQAGLLAYSASKGGVLGFSFALAYDHQEDHVRVNVIVPGGTVTGMTEGAPFLAQAAQTGVAGRNTLPEDIAAGVSYLLSDEAAVVTGAVLNIGVYAGQGGPFRPRSG